MSRQGQNVWFELMTRDPSAAQRFYTETIGWKTQTWEHSDPSNLYTMWMVDERPVGGVMVLPEDAKKAGAPPHWLAYTRVDDVDATCAKAEKLSGAICKAPFDVPKVGRMAVLSDPQGAVFAVFKPEQDMPFECTDSPGEFSWSELNTTDYEAAWRFYSDLFGWQHKSSMDIGEMGTYWMWHDAADVTRGGMCNSVEQLNAPPFWLYYITVDDMDAAVGRINQHGGKVMHGPMEISGNDRIAVCQDPQGASFAIYAAGNK